MKTPFFKTILDDKRFATIQINQRGLSKPALIDMLTNVMADCNIIAQLASRKHIHKLSQATILNIANAISEGYAGGNDMFHTTNVNTILKHMDVNLIAHMDDKPDDAIILPKSQFDLYSMKATDDGNIVMVDPMGNIYVNGKVAK